MTILIVSALTWASDLVDGLQATTTNRTELVQKLPAWALLNDVGGWAGITFALMIGGGIFLMRRQPILAVVLLGGTMAATSLQIWMGEAASLHKHLTLGIIFGAPLAGVMLAALVRAARRLSILLVVGICYATLISGLIQSEKLFHSWPNTAPLRDTVTYAVDSMPWIRALAEVPEPLTYSLEDKTDPWQWTGTYKNSFYYADPTAPGKAPIEGLEAYQHALRDNYFQLVILDRSTGIGQQLQPEEYGFTHTDTVTDPASGHTWRIYQRFDRIPK